MGVLTQEGCFTGGLCAYGYQCVKLGRTNRRKQEVFDLAICEEEAFVVRIIFRLAADEGYGAQRIANHLNAKGIKNRSGKNWHPASIQGMLKNILYTGILRSGESRSEVQEQLRIIDDKTFATVQEMLAARSRKQEAIRSKPLNTRGKSLLTGNIFCGHCGARLCVTTSGKGRRRQDGTDVVRMRYTCQTKSRTHGECDGQTGYTVEKLDAMIDSIIQGIFSRVLLALVGIVCPQRRTHPVMQYSRFISALAETGDFVRFRVKGGVVVCPAVAEGQHFSPPAASPIFHPKHRRMPRLQAEIPSGGNPVGRSRK